MTIEEISELKIPFVGVGCIVTHADRLLLVRSQGGEWGPPGGHLDFGESLETCATRETLEETGVHMTNVEFVAVTNDLLTEAGKHYVTVWMRAEAEGSILAIGDPAEIAEVGWFSGFCISKIFLPVSACPPNPLICRLPGCREMQSARWVPRRCPSQRESTINCGVQHQVLPWAQRTV